MAHDIDDFLTVSSDIIVELESKKLSFPLQR